MSFAERYFLLCLTLACVVLYGIHFRLFNPPVSEYELDTNVPLLTLPQTQQSTFYFLDAAASRQSIDDVVAQQILDNRRQDTTNPGALLGGTLTWKDVTTPYVQANGNPTAPETGGATWFGSGLVDDGRPTHFIGHTPGDYWWVFSVSIGDTIVVTDGNGNDATYEVVSLTDSNDEGYDRNGQLVLTDLLAIKGESINIQTCYDNDWNLIVHATLVSSGF